MDIVNPDDVMDIVGQDLVNGSNFAVKGNVSALRYVAESLDAESLDGESSEQFVRKSSKCSSFYRTRVVLSFKKYIIDLYFEFLNKPASLEDAILQDLTRNS
jgi:hypothetical protein